MIKVLPVPSEHSIHLTLVEIDLIPHPAETNKHDKLPCVFSYLGSKLAQEAHDHVRRKIPVTHGNIEANIIKGTHDCCSSIVSSAAAYVKKSNWLY